jgi:hypothetical protein
MITNDINELWVEKIRVFSTKIRQIAKGDDDLYQEGLLGLHEALCRDPRASDTYLVKAAKWRISRYMNRGVSIDNGSRRTYKRTLANGIIKEYRKCMTPIYIDALMGDFNIGFPDSSYPPDILALDRICARKFYSLLNQKEAELVDVCIQMHSHRESKVRKSLGVGQNTYRKIKRDAYAKFIRAFGSDEDIQILDEQCAMSEMHE